MFRSLFIPIVATIFAAATGVAHAQTGPDANLDARVRGQTLDGLRPADAAEALATGEGDLILLRRARIFALEANINANDTDNAFLTEAEKQHDRFATIELAASARLGLGARTSLTGRVAATTARYDKFGDLDYSAATATLALQTRRFGLDWTAYYQRAEIFDKSFSKRTLTQNQFHAEVARTFSIGDWTVDAAVHAERITADPEDYDNTAVGADASVSHPIPHLPQVVAFAQVGYEKRRYDSFFEDIVGVSRHDENASASIGAAWSVTRNIQLVAGYGFRRNRSSSDVNRYEAGSAFIGLSTRLRM